jgi:hypothetical protein
METIDIGGVTEGEIWFYIKSEGESGACACVALRKFNNGHLLLPK